MDVLGFRMLQALQLKLGAIIFELRSVILLGQTTLYQWYRVCARNIFL